jgi:hypothetical protein
VGHVRAVFAHPEREDWVVKVMRKDAVEARWGGARRWYKRLPRARHYASYVRELKEYIALQARHPGAIAPIARPRGIVETDLGLGLVMERIRGTNGGLAPTLLQLLREQGGMTALLDEELALLFSGLQSHEIIVGDLHAGNIVYGSDARGGPRLILIDGFGEKNIVPRCSMSRRFNRLHTRQQFARLRREIARLAATAPSAGQVSGAGRI